MYEERSQNMSVIEVTDRIPTEGSYDVIVAGGGVSGAAAAVAARRMGSRVLLIEKSISLGGLATIGLINLFVPMCNGRGVQIIKGMAEEFLRLSIRYGYDTIPKEWRDGEPGEGATSRYVTRFSPAIFSLALTELMKEEQVDILYDTVVSAPVMEGGHCKGLIVENKSGRQYYEGKIIIDTTGDGDILYRAGVPVVQGGNYFTMTSLGADLNSCQAALKAGDIEKVLRTYAGGNATLYGERHPENMPQFEGTNVGSVTDFIVKNHLATLERIKEDNRKERDIIMLPAMAQLRTTRTLIGDAVFSKESAYEHCETSIGAICDFDRRDYLYEVPYGALVKTGYDNLMTAGRTASAKPDYSWDVLRVIPPAIITGQAAGTAAALAVTSGRAVYDVDVAVLQEELERQNVMIHFDDSLIPADREASGERVDIGHM